VVIRAEVGALPPYGDRVAVVWRIVVTNECGLGGITDIVYLETAICGTVGAEIGMIALTGGGGVMSTLTTRGGARKYVRCRIGV
jgi:hypothetical protein